MRDRDNNSFNKPVRQAGYRNHFLRMSRTEPRSRCPLVPRQSPHLRKPRKHLLALLTLLTPPARTGVNTTEMRDHIDQVIKGTNVFATTASIHAHRKRPECVSKSNWSNKWYRYGQLPRYPSPNSCARGKLQHARPPVTSFKTQPTLEVA